MAMIDRLPEQVHYRDDGCEYSPSCLTCPLPACRYDVSPRLMRQRARATQAQQYRDEGMTRDQVAAAMGLSVRSVDRLHRLAVGSASPSAFPPPAMWLLSKPAHRSVRLTRAEEEVGRLVAAGMSNMEIARTLGIGISSVKHRLEAARARTNTGSRKELGAWMARQGEGGAG